MAGGQERILRQRIRSINATKKITRAFELIAASRIVRAQQRVHAAQPYSDQITEVVKDLSAAGGEVQSPLLSARPQIRRACHVVIAADRGLSGAYNSSVIRAAEGEIKNDARAQRRLLARARRAQGRVVLPVPRLRHRRRVHRLHRDALLRERPGDRPDRASTCTSPARSTPSSSSTPASCRPASRRSCCGRSCRSSTSCSPAATPSRPAPVRAPAPTTSSSRRPAPSSRRCCPATSRPGSTPPSSTPPRRSRRPASGP